MAHLLAGLVFVALGVWGMIAWWDSFGLVTRGLAPFASLALGLVAILSGLFRTPHVEERRAPQAPKRPAEGG